MQFGVLGPIEVLDDGVAIPIPAAKERTLLALLLAEPSRVVPVERLIDELWGDTPPRSANKTLQTYVSHLRRFLADRLVTEAPGYALLVSPGELDAIEFERLATEGRLALLRDDATTATRLLGGALALWRGAAFSGVDLAGTVRAESIRLDELRLAATEDWFDARVAAGDQRDLTAELEAAVARHPLRERMWAVLMRALYRSGRQADALRAFQRARAVLVDELGIEPGPELRAVEAAVLGQRLGATTAGLAGPGAHYATNPDGMQIAYWTTGSGERDVVFLGEIYMNLELVWELEGLVSMFDRLQSGARVIAVQRRGVGLSDRDAHVRLVTPQECVADVDAALADVGAGDVTLVGWGHGGQLAVAYAAARPDRVTRLVTVNSYARLSTAPGYTAGLSQDLLEAFLTLVSEKWGRNVSASPIFGPAGNDPALITRLARLERLTASPRDAIAMHRVLNDFDVRDLLPAVSCPALVIFLTSSISGEAGARWLADNLPSARYVELPGFLVPTAAEGDELGATIDAFLRDDVSR
jgi:DNA-binding SARP family transcriptional activator/pimeloyl-ACP methyl ester carboxylesterase